MSRDLLVFDASPLNHFARAGELEALQKLVADFECVTTKAVRAELRHGANDYPALHEAIEVKWLATVPCDDLEELWTARPATSRATDRHDPHPTRSMGPDRPALSSGLQALGLRATWGVPFQVHQHLLRWRRELEPSPYSRSYLVDVRYHLGHHPEVSVRQPALEPNDKGWLPHFYHHNDTLCLYDQGEWHPSMHLAWTILPWTIEWLFHYEIWKATGVWHSSGDDMAWANITPLDQLPANVTSRRRSRRHPCPRLAA